MLLFAKLTFARPDLDLVSLIPLLVLGALMVVALLFELKPEVADSHGELAPSSPYRPIAMIFSAIGLIGLIALFLASNNGILSSTFNGMLANDPFSRWSGLLIAFCALLTILAGQEELERQGNRHGGEFIALILGASIGMLLMASALSTMVMFLGLELFSIALYLLCIFFPERASSRESGMKYFLLSSAASAVMLYGMAMLYGATGSTWLADMTNSPGLHGKLAVVGGVFVLCGLLFKLAAAPFHFWAPDVYEGAPTTVTAFMSVATKVAALTTLWRVFVIAAPELRDHVAVPLAATAVLSMFAGNLLAIGQTSVKRMLAYSGIGNAGYLLIAPCVGEGMEDAMMFFLSAYMFANIGAFLSLSVVEGVLGREVTRADLRGLYRTHPGLAGVFALCLASLAGIPPAGGFLGKFLLLGRAISLGNILLPAVGVFCSVMGAAYYMGTAISLFDGREESAVEKAMPIQTMDTDGESTTSMTSVALVLCATGILILGVVPAPFMDWIAHSAH